MELRVLRYFVAVADAGSVTAGSAASHVSQPAVSRQLRALERELGVELLVRSEGGVRLTAAGAELLVLVRGLLEQEATLKRTAAFLASGRLTSLTIAAPSTTLSDVIAPFLAAGPARGALAPEVNVVSRSTSEVFAALGEGADIVVAPAVPPPEVASMLIAELPVRAYVGARGVLDGEGAERDRSVSLEALARVDPLVMLPGRHPVSQVLTRAFAEAGLAPQHVQEVDSPEAAQALAASGRGVAVLTNDTRFGLIPRRVRDADGSVLTMPLHAAWTPAHHAVDEIAALAAELRDFCARLYRDDLTS